MYSDSTTQIHTGIEKETAKNLAIGIVLGNDLKNSSKQISVSKFFKIMHMQFIIEKLTTGFFNCSDMQSGLTYKFKIVRSTGYINSLLNELMTYYRYNNGTNYCVEKYHLLMDKIRRDQTRINQLYNLEFEKDERYNCYYLVPKIEYQVPTVPHLSLVPKLALSNVQELVPIPNIIEIVPIEPKQVQTVSQDPSFDYFEYLFKKVVEEQKENLIDYLFNLLNQYVSYSMDDLMGSIEDFEQTTLLQFMIIPEKSQFACICKLLNILSE